MTLPGIESLLSSSGTQIKFLASENNKTLHDKLNEIARNHAGLEVISIPETSSKSEGFRNRLKRGRINVLAQRLRELAPDLSVAVQGNIEHPSLSLPPLRARPVSRSPATFPSRTPMPKWEPSPELSATFPPLLGQQRWRGASLIQPRLDGPADRSAETADKSAHLRHS
jgi:hypothetical protein